MNGEDQIAWVTLTLNFSPDQEVRLETRAQAAGLSLKCYCVHRLHERLMEDATAEQKEQWQRNFPVTLRRNNCDDGAGVAFTTT